MQNTKYLRKVTGLAPGKRPSSRRLAQLTLAALVASGIAFGGTAHADILAQYNFSGTAPAALNSVDTDTKTTANPFGFGAGLGANGGVTTQGYGSPANSVFGRVASTPSTAALAVSGNSYFSFSISANTGIRMTLQTITFDTATTGTVGTLVGNYEVRSSLDGYTTSLGGRTGQAAVTAANTAPFTAAPTVTLGSQFQNLTSPVEFRIFLYDNDNNTNNAHALRVDNVVLNGTTVATPEPETWAMMGLGLAAVAFMGWKRRKNNAQQAPIAAGLAA